MAQSQRPVKVGLHCQARCHYHHEDSVAYTLSTSSLIVEVEAVTHALRWIASRGDRPHMPPSRIQWACYKKWKVHWEVQTGMYRWSTSTFENSSGCTALDMLKWREMTEQIEWRAKQSSQVNCFSEDLKCWEAWDITCGHKAKDIKPLIAWRREALKEEALDHLPWKDRERHRQSDEHWNRIKGNIGETSERRGGAHMGFSESTDTILNWTIGQYHSDTPCKQRWNTADAEIEVFSTVNLQLSKISLSVLEKVRE